MNESFILKELTKQNIKEMFNYELNTNIVDLLNKEELIKLGFKYAIIYNYDCVISEKIENIDIDVDNIIEARFFNLDNEIRFFNDENLLTATVFVDKTDKNSTPIEESYYLYPRNKQDKNRDTFPSKFKVKKYLNYDEDGQAYIAYVKPCEFIFDRREI